MKPRCLPHVLRLQAWHLFPTAPVLNTQAETHRTLDENHVGFETKHKISADIYLSSFCKPGLTTNFKRPITQGHLIFFSPSTIK